MTDRTPALSRSAADRDAATREDAAALEAAWARGKVLVVDDGAALVTDDGPSLVLLDAGEAPDGDRLYLGRDEEAAYFAVAGKLPRRLGARPLGLREVGALLGDRDAGLLVHAVGLANWHATHPHCARCGAPTEAARGGSVRRCTADGSEHFPRTDPAVIMLVTDGADRCVLGRQAVWPAGRFSTLAGFVEPGESAEQAVVREVAEETGIAVRDVVYRGSQPWPFPASLMLGYRAICDGDAEPRPRDGELEDARWLSKDELRSAKGALLPTPVSIAWRLITDWLDGV
ncbi:MAG: NAD(+) diphosphatase [Actinobacteria bacterium]|nr:NAD(+) diphosphatase [Actinomycetota bacterium]MCA1721436.1 NAD(+) diphosphatase [Actinomycetota bacterium]